MAPTFAIIMNDKKGARSLRSGRNTNLRTFIQEVEAESTAPSNVLTNILY